MNAPAHVPLAQVGDLMTPGQPLPFSVLDANGRLLLAAGQPVIDATQLRTLLERGACVTYAEVEAARQARAGAAAAAGGITPSTRRRTLFDLWERQTWALDALLRRVAKGGPLASELEAFTLAHIELVDRHADAALFVCIRQDDRRFALYGLTHALHTATVMLLCARQLGWEPARTQSAVAAALTMNASILELQAQMAEQSDPPAKRQLDQIRAHPPRSAQMLRDAGVSDAAWLEAVEQHHEQPGGGGYPAGLQEVGETARMVRAADVFMAKISPRALRAALPPQVAARQLFQQEQGGSVAGALIKALGIYPPGDFVKLRNGETAIVVQRAPAGGAPAVVSVVGANGKRLGAAQRRDTSQAEFSIAGPVAERAGLPRVLPEQVYGIIEA